MKINNYRHMQLLLMFDLPVDTIEQRRIYSRFHQKLIKNGFIMIQYSIYSRFCLNDTEAKKYINRFSENIPSRGNIRILKITDNQYRNMILLSGERTEQEEIDLSSDIFIVWLA